MYVYQWLMSLRIHPWGEYGAIADLTLQIYPQKLVKLCSERERTNTDVHFSHSSILEDHSKFASWEDIFNYWINSVGKEKFSHSNATQAQAEY